MAFDPTTATPVDDQKQAKPAFDPATARPVPGQETPLNGANSTFVAGTTGGDWKTLYGGLDGLDDRVNDYQRQGFQELDAVSKDPKEARASAINQSFLQTQLPRMNGDTISKNWPAVKQAYVKEKFGMDKKEVSDTELYGLISGRMKEDEEAEKNKTPWHWYDSISLPAVPFGGADLESLKRFHQAIGNVPLLKDLPEVTPEQMAKLPNTWLSGGLNPLGNPKLMAMTYNLLIPQIKAASTPESIGIMVATGALGKLAQTSKAAAFAMKEIVGPTFTAFMAAQTAAQTGEIKKVMADPKASLMDKAQAWATGITSAMMAAAGAIGSAHDVAPDAMKAIEGQPPQIAAHTLQEEAMKPEVAPADKVVLMKAAEDLHKLGPQPGEEPTELPPVEEKPLPVSDIKHESEATEQPIEGGAIKPGGGGYPGTPEPIPHEQPPPNEILPTGEEAEKIVGIKNSEVDREMEEMGLEPGQHGTVLKTQDVINATAATLKADPLAGVKLVDELKQKPRPLDANEDFLLLAEKNRRALARDAAETELTEAEKSKDPDRIAEANVKVAAARDSFIDVDTVADKVGTANAQGLAFRRYMMKRDYSLASMERQMAAATPGGKLDPEDADAIRGLSKEIRDSAGEIEKHKAKANKNREAMRQGALKKQIADLDDQIQSGKRTVAKRGTTKLTDDETFRLKELRDSLKSAYDVMFPEKGEAELTPEQELNRALAAKDRQIQELERQIDQQEPFAPGKKPESTDPRMAAKQAQIDALKEEREYLRDSLQTPTDPPTKMEKRLEALDRQIEAVRKQLRDEAPFSKGKKPQPLGQEAQVKQDQLDALKQQREFLRDRLQPRGEPKTEQERRLAAYKNRTANAIQDLQKRTANEDFLPKKKAAPLEKDQFAEVLQAEHERAKQKFDQMVLDKKYEQLSKYEKVLIALPKWRRAFVLSRYTTLLKLTAAATARLVLTPVEEVISAPLGKLASGESEAGFRRGGLNVKALGHAYASAFTTGMRDAYDTIRTGRSNLDALYGKNHDPAIGEGEFAPRQVVNFMGTLHAALKTVPKRMEFELSYGKRIASLTKAGVDVTNPLVQERVAVESYKDANRSIFMQDNVFNDIWKGALRTAENNKIDPAHGTYVGKTVAAIGRVAVPITKVPFNVAGEAIEHVVGAGTGSIKLAVAMHKGFDALPAAQKDIIVRQITKGTLGLGGLGLALGYFHGKDSPIKFGGLYQPGHKYKAGELKPGEISVFGHVINAYFLDNSLVIAIQVGQGVLNAAESKFSKKDKEERGLLSGLWAGALGVVDLTPAGREMEELGRIVGGGPEGRAAQGEFVKDLVIPGAVSQEAEREDKDSNGNPIKRDPKTVGEHVESGIPVLREKLPKRKPSYSSRP